MMKRVLIIVGVVFLIALLMGGGFLAYQGVRRTREIFQALQGSKMPHELESARVVSGADLFSKEIFYSQPDLDVVTDIQQKQNHEVVIVGQSGAAFLPEDHSLARNIHFGLEKCSSKVVAVDLGGAFLCRGSWNTDVTLFDVNGKRLWSYGDLTQGIDDAAAGALGKDGLERVVIGSNGDGGVRLLSSDGKELWKRDDANVWHVEITAADDASSKVIVHSNAAGQLTIRNETGSIVARYNPEIYLADFSLTAWNDDPHLNKLVAVDENFVYVLTMKAETVARLPAPGNAGIAEPRGTPVHFSKGTPYYASLLRHNQWNRSLLYIYDTQNQIVYDEIIKDDCAALRAVPKENGAEDLLLGCDGSVWKYSEAKRH